MEVGAHHSQAHLKIAGEIGDLMTSPNDPIFYSYHADIDRNVLTWMNRADYLSSEYWGYPFDQSIPKDAKAALSGPFNIYHLQGCSTNPLNPDYVPFKLTWPEGTLLDDVINKGYAFSNLFGETCKTKPYTVRDLIDLTTKENTIYTYDTLLDMYDDCEDLSSCSSGSCGSAKL